MPAWRVSSTSRTGALIAQAREPAGELLIAAVPILDEWLLA